MPTYDYKCKACGHGFEEFQSMTAPVLKKCPKCGKNQLERLIGTGAALMFKGSGFYITDYRSDSYKKAAQAETGGSSSSGDSAKSESKSTGETKSAPAPAKEAAPKPAETKSKSKKSSKSD